jgi:hypothetical protein
MAGPETNMKERRIGHLFSAARKESAPEVPFDFAQRVVAAVQRAEQPREATVLDQLGALFPRLAWVAAAVVALSLATEFYLATQQTSLSAEVNQVAEQWLFAAK